MNNSHITCQTGRSYLELLLVRLSWVQLGLIQNSQALLATVEKKDESVGRHQFRICEHPYIDLNALN